MASENKCLSGGLMSGPTSVHITTWGLRQGEVCQIEVRGLLLRAAVKQEASPLQPCVCSGHIFIPANSQDLLHHFRPKEQLEQE